MALATVAAIAGVASAAVGVASSIKGMSSAKKQNKAQQQAIQENSEATRAYNEDTLELLEKQQHQQQQFREASYKDTRAYTMEKGLKLLSQQKDMGWEKLIQAASTVQDGLNLTGKQQGEQAALAMSNFLTKEQQLANRNRLEEEKTGKAVTTDLNAKLAMALNDIGGLNEQWANDKARLALQDQAAVADNATKSAARALEQRIGVGRIVASEAARGVSGGAATTAKLLGKQLAIQQQADDVNLKLQRGLYALAGTAADQQRLRGEQSIRLGFERERALGQLQIEGLTKTNRLTEAQFRASNDLAYSGLLLDQSQALERQAFTGNKALEEQYLAFDQGLRAGMTEIGTRLADLDFQHGQESAEAAMRDALQMEQAQLTAKHNVTLNDISNRLNSTTASITASGAMWQGMAGLSQNLFGAAKGISGMFETKVT